MTRLPSRSALLAFGVVGVGVLLLVGLWILFAPDRELRSARMSSFSKLRVGMTREEVIAALGEPDWSGVGDTPPGNVRDQAARQRLASETRSYVLYLLVKRNRSIVPCSADYLDGSVGFDSHDRVLWYDAMLGETYVVHAGPG